MVRFNGAVLPYTPPRTVHTVNKRHRAVQRRPLPPERAPEIMRTASRDLLSILPWRNGRISKDDWDTAGRQGATLPSTNMSGIAQPDERCRWSKGHEMRERVRLGSKREARRRLPSVQASREDLANSRPDPWLATAAKHPHAADPPRDWDNRRPAPTRSAQCRRVWTSLLQSQPSRCSRFASSLERCISVEN